MVFNPKTQMKLYYEENLNEGKDFIGQHLTALNDCCLMIKMVYKT